MPKSQPLVKGGLLCMGVPGITLDVLDDIIITPEAINEASGEDLGHRFSYDKLKGLMYEDGAQNQSGEESGKHQCC